MPDNKYSDDVRQHLSFLQVVITRMNSNSFSMKGWMVAIVSALCAVYASNADKCYACIYLFVALIADILFLYLDAYYLKVEKEFRNLYNKVLKSPVDTDFSMDTSDYKVCLWKAIKSPSVWILYTVVALILIISLCFLLLT